jgi:hypothetical protein
MFAQNIEEQMTKTAPTCNSVFMNAMGVLPSLYRAGSFDSMARAVDIWERSCGNIPEVKITRILLDMQESKFSMAHNTDGTTAQLLCDYAISFPPPAVMQGLGTYNDQRILFYRFSSTCAKLLAENKKLSENEIFICRVLKGEIKNPEKEVGQNKETYPEFAVLFEKYFESKRKEVRTTIAIGTGVWIPTNNLSTLGVHPSFTFQVGGRSMHHELDFTVQIRYLESANTYAVNRNGHLDSTNYYVGGYIGLDYTYYVVSKKRYDIGVMAGMGWDGFDFAEDPYYYYYYDYPWDYYHSHVTIGSFNGNAGLRFNYYFSHSFYMGLQGRYNGIHYSTHGGTNLSGDAISIDLIFGFHNAK